MATGADRLDGEAASGGPAGGQVESIASGDRRALAAYYETRAAAVLAYCSRVCEPQQIGAAVEAAFAQLFEAVGGGEVASDAQLDGRLLRAVRFAAAERAGSGGSASGYELPAVQRLFERVADGQRGSACELMPRLLAAHAEGELTAGDEQRLLSHLRRCVSCRTLERRFDDAERALKLLLPAAPPAVGRSLLATLVDGDAQPIEAAVADDGDWFAAPREPERPPAAVPAEDEGDAPGGTAEPVEEEPPPERSRDVERPPAVPPPERERPSAADVGDGRSRDGAPVADEPSVEQPEPGSPRAGPAEAIPPAIEPPDVDWQWPATGERTRSAADEAPAPRPRRSRRAMPGVVSDFGARTGARTEATAADEAPSPTTSRAVAKAAASIETATARATSGAAETAAAEPDAPPQVARVSTPPTAVATAPAEAVTPARAATATRPRLKPPAQRGGSLRRRIAWALAAVGLLLVAEASLTVLWKEPLTAYLASRSQGALRAELDRLTHADAGPTVARAEAKTAAAGSRASTDAHIAALASSLALRSKPGEALGRLVIPRIGVDYVVVQGVDGASLRTGPGHYRETVLPGIGGTVGIAGHRTTYLAPFRNIDALRPGDAIVLTMPYGRFRYAVMGQRIVPAGRTDAFRSTGGQALVLSACHPLYSSSQRILVRARLVARQPLGAAARSQAPPAVDTHAAARRTATQRAGLGSETLALAATGPAVRELQYLLGIPASGYFGYQTQSAVEGFERANGMTPDGIVGDRFKSLLARRQQPPLQPPTPPPVAPAHVNGGR